MRRFIIRYLLNDSRKENIDVIMCDKDDNIVVFYEDIKRNKVILPKKNVYKTIELPVGYYKVKIGDKIIIKP